MLQSMRLQRVWHDLALNNNNNIYDKNSQKITNRIRLPEHNKYNSDNNNNNNKKQHDIHS